MSDEGQQEPSMEEILASIRKILSEDEEEGGEEDAAEAEPKQAAEPEPKPEEDDSPDLTAMLAESDEDGEAAFAEPEEALAEPTSFELPDEMIFTEEVPDPEPSPEAEQQSTPPPPQPLDEQPYQTYGQEGIVADKVEQVAGEHIAQLAQAVAQERALTIGNQGITLEQLVREICTPILKQWLDHNLPHMVERIVRQEVERIVSRSERM
ncbi:MAG: DUF2497 domain-containing protein [Rhodospirillaceae bacterium]|nr:DUF2497 domain-containing protein [Rhodospirillaceae bacterium]